MDLNDYRWNSEMPVYNNMSAGSPYCSITRGNGRLRYTEIDVDGDGGEVIVNCFSFDGPIAIVELWAVLTDATDVTTASGVYFDAYDGANSAAVTADGVDCSGATVDAVIVKNDDNTGALELLDADQVRVSESAFNKEFVEAFINIKNGGTHYIRLRTDTDVNTDMTWRVYMAYSCRDINTTVEAV